MPPSFLERRGKRKSARLEEASRRYRSLISPTVGLPPSGGSTPHSVGIRPQHEHRYAVFIGIDGRVPAWTIGADQAVPENAVPWAFARATSVTPTI